MSEGFLERLSRFTPDAGRLDRDALLFAAGRASVRPNHGWKALAALLAGTQALSLVLLWPHPTPPAGDLAGQVPTVKSPARSPEPPRSEGFASPGVWSARPNLLESDLEDYRDETVTFIDSGPPLRAFGSPPPSILN
jgi:hypothetical protein